jgi:hypothetical protein
MPKRHFSKTRRRYRRKGGNGSEDYDIEQGPVIPVVPLRRIPTDPIRKREELGRHFTKSMPADEAEAFFSGPTPEGIQGMERSMMGMEDKEDPDIAAYTDYSDMPLFSKGGIRRTRRHKRKTRRVRRKTKRHYKR